ncbi:hypothetical protein [Gluconobacter japonicus]|uniref:hypothetical protein n=1 Tax=Gluconobacter japonicus TaxID=376620 RepID=UPI001B8B7A37|nr:hypothetical protein [Gluconobacter japonicus]MBS1050492.1 hypothetical protein [Gluconobacter japonicus]
MNEEENESCIVSNIENPLTKESIDVYPLVEQVIWPWKNTRKRQPIYRTCYCSQQVLDFIEHNKDRRSLGTTSIGQQTKSILNQFVSTPNYAAIGQFTDAKPLGPITKMRPVVFSGPNVWEMRTTDVRIFGWIHVTPNIFVAICAVTKDELVDENGIEIPEAYDKKIDYVVAWRDYYSIDASVVWKGIGDDAPKHFSKQ